MTVAHILVLISGAIIWLALLAASLTGKIPVAVAVAFGVAMFLAWRRYRGRPTIGI